MGANHSDLNYCFKCIIIMICENNSKQLYIIFFALYFEGSKLTENSLKKTKFE